MTLDTARRRVARHGRPLDLGTLSFDLLKVLVESAPGVVTHDELSEKVWHRRFVSAENMAQRVKLLRQALSDDASEPRYIETVRGQGYRLAATIQRVSAETVPGGRRGQRLAGAAVIVALVLAAGGFFRLFWAPALGPPALPASVGSVAVLPFEILTPDPAKTYIADGLHIEIIDKLTRVGLKVTSRAVVLQYIDDERPLAELAAELRVQLMLMGTILYADERIRVNLQLVDPVSGTNLQALPYQSELADVLAVQADIAAYVANALAPAIPAPERHELTTASTTSPEAYDLYLKALTADSGDIGQLLVTRALEFDSSFAEAYALRAQIRAYSVIDHSGGRAASVDPAEARAAVLQDARAALEIDDRSWRSHTAMGIVNFWFWHWEEALQHYKEAHSLRPHGFDVSDFSYLTLLSAVGQRAEAIELAQRGAPAGHVTAESLRNLGLAYAYADQPITAAAHFREAADLSPSNGMLRHWLGQMEGALGNRAAALAELRAAERLTLVPNPALIAGLLYSYSRIGQTEDVARLFAELERMAADGAVGAGTWALAYLALDDAAAAQRWLAVAVHKIQNGEPDAGALNLLTIKLNYLEDPILDSRPFRDLRAKIGLSE